MESPFTQQEVIQIISHRINAAIMSLPRTLSVSGGEWMSWLAWTLGFCVMIGGSVERLGRRLIERDFEQ